MRIFLGSAIVGEIANINNMQQKQNFASAIKLALPNNQGLQLTDNQLGKFKTATQVVLAILATAGVASMAIIAPNSLQLVDKFIFKRKRGRRYEYSEKREKLTETFYYLKRSGLIQVKQEKGGLFVSLTGKGRQRAKKINWITLEIPKPKQWNGRWWLVAADIPTKDYKLVADALRRKLREMDFYPFQRTLWLYPHNPSAELDFIIHRFGIANFVTLMEVNKLDVEDEKRVKGHFKKSGIL